MNLPLVFLHNPPVCAYQGEPGELCQKGSPGERGGPGPPGGSGFHSEYAQPMTGQLEQEESEKALEQVTLPGLPGPPGNDVGNKQINICLGCKSSG